MLEIHTEVCVGEIYLGFALKWYNKKKEEERWNVQQSKVIVVETEWRVEVMML